PARRRRRMAACRDGALRFPREGANGRYPRWRVANDGTGRYPRRHSRNRRRTARPTPSAMDRPRSPRCGERAQGLLSRPGNHGAPAFQGRQQAVPVSHRLRHLPPRRDHAARRANRRGSRVRPAMRARRRLRQARGARQPDRRAGRSDATRRSGIRRDPSGRAFSLNPGVLRCVSPLPPVRAKSLHTHKSGGAIMRLHSKTAVRTAVVLLLASVATTSLQAADYTFRIEPAYPADRVAEIYAPLMTYLNKATGQHFTLVTTRNYHFYWRDIQNSVKTDFAFD